MLLKGYRADLVLEPARRRPHGPSAEITVLGKIAIRLNADEPLG
jgi:hypothetical protein